MYVACSKSLLIKKKITIFDHTKQPNHRCRVPHLLIVFIAVLIQGKLSAQNSLNDSLIAYYPFNGNALDESGNGNNGTVSGATLVADRFGNPNSAYSFNGLSDYIDYKAGPKFKPRTFPISICLWIKTRESNIIGTFFKTDFAEGIYTGITIQVQVSLGGILEVHYGDGGPTSSDHRRSKFGTTVINDGQWHFVAAVIRGPTDMDLYVDCHYENGSYEGGGGNMVYTNADGRSGEYDVLSGDFFYDGIADDIRYYHRELTQTDLELLYAYPKPFNQPVTVNLGKDTTLCIGRDSLTITPVTTGNISQYLWSDGSAGKILTAYNPGVYWVIVSNGCSAATDSIKISSPISISAHNATVCAGDTVQLHAYAFPDTGVTYSWNPAIGLSCTTCPDPFVQGLTNTKYFVTVISTEGCIAKDSLNVIIQHHDSISITVLPSSTINKGDSVQLKATGGSSYIWSPSAGLSCTQCANPVAQPDTTTTYYITSGNGECAGSDSVTIVVLQPCTSILLPNAFTPNGDGHNDQFKLLIVDGNPQLKYLRIFNRWGQVVFETNDPDNAWDGTFNGKPAQMGVYAWVYDAICNNTEIRKAGNVTLLR